MDIPKSINASTELYGVIGNPVSHSLSPMIQNAAFNKFGMNAVYLAFKVEPGSIGLALEAMRSLGLRGLNVTVPFKEAALNFVDEVPEDADRGIGAINTVANRDGKLYGYNTDSPGFLTALGEELQFNPAGKSVLVLGAGGAARGVAFSLARAHARRVMIYNRTHERARGLSDYLAGYFPQVDIEPLETFDSIQGEKIDLVVNATSCGMKAEDPLPMDLNLLGPKTGVYDLIYSPKATRLLLFAKAKGLPHANGLGMLAAQAALSFEIWTGKREGVRHTMLESLACLK